MSSSSVLVSVVVPAYNAERFIAGTIESVRQQTHANLEIIIVNDGSADGTLEVAEAHARLDARIGIISQNNGGVAAARNAGLRQSRGKYVAFIDADDIWHPQKIERQVRKIAETPSLDCVFALYRLIDADDNVIGNGPYWTMSGMCFGQHVVMQPVGNGSSLLVSRSAAIEVGGFDSSYARAGVGGVEDLDFELKIAARYAMGAVPEYLVGYRIHDQNMSADRGRMARAMERTVRNRLDAGPILSRRSHAWAMSRVAVYQFFCYANMQHLGLSARALWTLLRIDPLFALQEVPWRLALRVLRHGRDARGKSFLQYDPQDIARRWHRPQMRKRLQVLAREDRMRALPGMPESVLERNFGNRDLAQNA